MYTFQNAEALNSKNGRNTVNTENPFAMDLILFIFHRTAYRGVLFNVGSFLWQLTSF